MTSHSGSRAIRTAHFCYPDPPDSSGRVADGSRDNLTTEYGYRNHFKVTGPTSVRPSALLLTIYADHPHPTKEEDEHREDEEVGT